MSFLHGVEVLELDTGTRTIETVKSSIIGLVGSAIKGGEGSEIYNPVVITSLKEGVEVFGEIDGKHSIPDALAGIFEQTSSLVVVVINVFKPKFNAQKDITFTFKNNNYKHVMEEENVANLELIKPAIEAVPAKSAVAPTDKTDGTPEILAVEAEEEGVYIEGKDYRFDMPTKTVTWLHLEDFKAKLEKNVMKSVDFIEIKGSYKTINVDKSYNKKKGEELEYFSEDYSYTYTAKVGISDIKAGIEALREASSVVKVTPKILIAPGYSYISTIASRMAGIAESLSGIAIVDVNKTDIPTAVSFREQFGESRLYLVEPNLIVYSTGLNKEVVQPASARVAGLLVKSDMERGFWYSPSNRIISGIIGTSRPIGFTLGDRNSAANRLNENEISTVICLEGYRLWGNRSCSSDPKWAFISVRRTADTINESLQRAHLWAIDRNITSSYMNDVVQSVNSYLDHLKQIGAIIDGKCWASDLNSVEEKLAGKVTFDFDFVPPYPAESITFRSILNSEYLKSI